MGVYVRIRIRRGNRELTCIAVVNTGFRSSTPDIILPVEIARQIGLWPPPEAYIISAESLAGNVQLYFVENAVEVEVITEDKVSRRILCNALISVNEREVLISDSLAEELGIQILFPRRGIWRFADDPPNVLRKSVKSD